MKKKSIGAFCLGVFVGGVFWFGEHRELVKQKKNTGKYLTLFRWMNQYVVTKQVGKSIIEYFKKNGYKKIAIYGMSHMGQRIIDDLENSDVEVLYGIDKRADRLSCELPIYKPEEDYPNVDVIVVTAYDFDEISNYLQEKVDCEIVAFDDIIFGI